MLSPCGSIPLPRDLRLRFATRLSPFLTIMSKIPREITSFIIFQINLAVSGKETMITQPISCKYGALMGPLDAISTMIGMTAMVLMLSVSTGLAGSATWKLNPPSGDWNTAANWMPSTVPNGSADTASFDVSNMLDVSLSANIIVNGIVFQTGASGFTISAPPARTLTFSGTGITNMSGITQNFVA